VGQRSSEASLPMAYRGTLAQVTNHLIEFVLSIRHSLSCSRSNLLGQIGRSDLSLPTPVELFEIKCSWAKWSKRFSMPAPLRTPCSRSVVLEQIGRSDSMPAPLPTLLSVDFALKWTILALEMLYADQ
jgi:hypothetical protein